MQPLKPLIRVTQLEAYRKYIEQSEYANYEITEQSVIESITGVFAGNEYTRIGTAFHSIVETGKPVCDKVSAGERTFLYYGKEQKEPVPCGRKFNIDGFDVILDVNQCKVAMDYRNEHPDAFHEIRIYKDFGDAVITGCADMIDGIEIRDIKTKYSYPSDTDYINSCQWRLYLEIFKADIFHFDLFVFDGYKIDKHGYDVRGLPLERYSPAITCYRYDGMERDNRNLLHSFLEWAEYRDLVKYLIKEKNMSSLFGSICLSEIPREQMKKVMCKDGKERIFLNIWVGERKEPATFGSNTYTHYVSCSPKKEERKDGVNYFLGDLQTYNPQPSAPSMEQVDSAPCVSPADDLPF